MNVAIVCFDGVDELDAIGPYRVFAGAADLGEDVAVSLVTVEPAAQVTSSHGIRLGVDGTLAAAEPDLVVVPGGGWNARGAQSAWAEAERGVIPEAIAALHHDGVPLAAVCTGTMLLAAAGLVAGRPATTHAGAIDDLREAGAEVVDARVVDDGDVVTAGGVSSGIDLALYVLEREFGESVATSVARNIEYERRDEAYEH